MPPLPSQVKRKTFAPVEETVTDSVPLIVFTPDQDPEATQVKELVEVQEISKEEPTSLVFKLEEKEVMTAASFSNTGPPGLPPPHEDIMKIEVIIKMFLY